MLPPTKSIDLANQVHKNTLVKSGGHKMMEKYSRSEKILLHLRNLPYGFC